MINFLCRTPGARLVEAFILLTSDGVSTNTNISAPLSTLTKPRYSHVGDITFLRNGRDRTFFHTSSHIRTHIHAHKTSPSFVIIHTPVARFRLSVANYACPVVAVHSGAFDRRLLPSRLKEQSRAKLSGQRARSQDRSFIVSLHPR